MYFNDLTSLSSVPRFSFSADSYTVEESNGTLRASILREGDTTLEASVICYSRQQSAEVMMDFEERLLSNASRVVFAPGEKVNSFSTSESCS